MGKQNLVMKNNAVLDTADDLETAYQRIEDELGMPVIELGYLPHEMKFQKLTIERNQAIMKFTYKGKLIYFKQEKLETSEHEVTQSFVSDRKEYKKIYNSWLKKEISIEKNLLQDGLVEYSFCITEKENTYYLSGIMQESDFLEIADGAFWR